MTFEDWWASLKNRPIPQLRPTFKECWDAALDAALDTGMVSGELDANAVTALKTTQH